MRRFILLVPLVLVGGYALLNARQHHHDHEVSVSVAPDVRILRHQAIAEGRLAEAEARAGQAEAIAAAAEELAAVAVARSAHPESVSAVVSASASLSVTLEGLIATIREELARSAETGEPIQLQSLQVSTELLAEIMAEFEGAIDIQATDSNQVLVGSADGARVEITIK